MVKVLSRDAVQRMTGRRSSTTSTVSGGGDGSGVSMAWVEENYISKNFFNQLFTIHGTHTYVDEETEEEVTEEVVITPNAIADGEEYKLSNVEVSVGLWTQQFLSALGLNPGGGGGGGATSLAELVDVTLNSPQNGQVLMYNSGTGKWYNGTVQSGGGGTVTSITAGTGLTGGTITASGTIALSQETLTAIDHGATAYGWGDHSQAGYLTSSAISDMATKTWVGQQDYLTSSALTGYATQSWVTETALSGYAKLTDNVASATKLQTARTIFGQNFDGTGKVSGDIFDINNVFVTGDYLLMSSGKSKYGLMIESSSWGENNGCAFGFHTAANGHSIAWSTRSGTDDICLNLIIDATNTVAKRYTRVYDALRIGDGMITWDSTNNALKAVKADGTALNFCATGGVSALGMSAGVSQMNAMTFNHLAVKNSLTFSGSVNIVTGTSSYIVRSANDYDCIYLMNSYAQSKLNSRQYYYNQYDNVGLHGTDYSYSETWYIDPDGCARFSRVYLNNNTYIYTNGSDLMLTIGSTTYKLTKTTA